MLNTATLFGESITYSVRLPDDQYWNRAPIGISEIEQVMKFAPFVLRLARETPPAFEHIGDVSQPRPGPTPAQRVVLYCGDEMNEYARRSPYFVPYITVRTTGFPSLTAFNFGKLRPGVSLDAEVVHVPALRASEGFVLMASRGAATIVRIELVPAISRIEASGLLSELVAPPAPPPSWLRRAWRRLVRVL